MARSVLPLAALLLVALLALVPSIGTFASNDAVRDPRPAHTLRLLSPSTEAGSCAGCVSCPAGQSGRSSSCSNCGTCSNCAGTHPSSCKRTMKWAPLTCVCMTHTHAIKLMDRCACAPITACDASSCAPTSSCPNTCTTCTGNTFATPGCASCTCIREPSCSPRQSTHSHRVAGRCAGVVIHTACSQCGAGYYCANGQCNSASALNERARGLTSGSNSAPVDACVHALAVCGPGTYSPNANSASCSCA